MSGKCVKLRESMGYNRGMSESARGGKGEGQFKTLAVIDY